MSDKNLVVLVGRLGRDAETRTTTTGKRVANLRVATSSSGRDGQERTAWHSVVAWQQLADQCAALLKGARIGVIGELRTRSYETREGVKKWVTEVVADSIQCEAPAQRSLGQLAQHTTTVASIDDEDIPF